MGPSATVHGPITLDKCGSERETKSVREGAPEKGCGFQEVPLPWNRVGCDGANRVTVKSLSAVSICSEANSASPQELETVIYLGSKITADGDFSHEIKRCLLLGRKAMKNLGSVLKNRDITLPTKVRLVKAMVFPVVMYRCESWTIKKADNQRIDAFELCCCRRLESPLDCKEIQPVHPKGNQS